MQVDRAHKCEIEWKKKKKTLEFKFYCTDSPKNAKL